MNIIDFNKLNPTWQKIVFAKVVMQTIYQVSQSQRFFRLVTSQEYGLLALLNSLQS